MLWVLSSMPRLSRQSTSSISRSMVMFPSWGRLMVEETVGSSSSQPKIWGYPDTWEAAISSSSFPFRLTSQAVSPWITAATGVHSSTRM